MELTTLSKAKGLTLIYYKGYIIYSDVYGIVAYTSNITRSDDAKKVDITLNIVFWDGLWSLQDIVKRAITKREKIDNKTKVNYKVITVGDEQHPNTAINNKYMLDIKLIKR